MERVTAENLKPIVNQMIAEEAHVMTDSSTVLKGALIARKHDQVNHVAKEYARYEDGVCITTNTIEGYFATVETRDQWGVPSRRQAAPTPLS